MRLVLAALLALLLSAPSSAGASPSKLVHLVRGNTYEMRDDAASVAISIPVTPAAGVRVGTLRATVVSVALGLREDLALADRFEVTPMPTRGGHGPRLELKVETEPGLEPGDYALIVDLRRTGKPKAKPSAMGMAATGKPATHLPKRQRLKLTIKHPAATLRAPAIVKIEHTGGFLLWPEDTQVRRLHLSELSDKTRLSGIDVTQVDGPTGSRVTSGEVEFAKVPDVAPGDHEVAVPTLSGKFPLGTSTGTLEVDARQLDGPVSVAYEVSNKLNPLWLAVAIFAGVALGYFVRFVLKNAIERNQARQRGWALLDAIAAERARRPDKPFRDGLDGISTKLMGELKSERDVAAIGTQVDGTQKELNDAVQDLEGRRTAALSDLGTLLELVGTHWAAPPSVTAALESQAEELKRAESQIESYHVAAAQASIDGAREGLASGVRAAAQPWGSEVLRFLGEMSDLPLPPALAAELRLARATITPALAVLDDPRAGTDKILEGVNAAESQLRHVIAEGLPGIVAIAGEVAEVLRGSGGSAELEAIRKAADALTAAVAESTAGRRDLSVLLDSSGDVLDAMRRAVRGAVHDNALASNVSAAMNAGRYVDAARKAAEAASRPKDRALGTVRGATVAQPEASPEAVGAPAAVPPPPRSVVRLTMTVRDGAVGTAIARYSSVAALFVLKPIRTLLVLLVAVAAGFLIFEPSFSGTFEQFATAFFWGFAADLTVEGAYAYAKSSGAPPATPGTTTAS